MTKSVIPLCIQVYKYQAIANKACRSNGKNHIYFHPHRRGETKPLLVPFPKLLVLGDAIATSFAMQRTCRYMANDTPPC